MRPDTFREELQDEQKDIVMFDKSRFSKEQCDELLTLLPAAAHIRRIFIVDMSPDDKTCDRHLLAYLEDKTYLEEDEKVLRDKLRAKVLAGESRNPVSEEMWDYYNQKFLPGMLDFAVQNKNLTMLGLYKFLFDNNSFTKLLKAIDANDKLTDLDLTDCLFDEEQVLELVRHVAMMNFCSLTLPVKVINKKLESKIYAILGKSKTLVDVNNSLTELNKIAELNQKTLYDSITGLYEGTLTDEQKRELKRLKKSAEKVLEIKMGHLEAMQGFLASQL